MRDPEPRSAAELGGVRGRVRHRPTVMMFSVLAWFGVVACEVDPSTSAPAPSARDVPEPITVPASREAFLAQVAPLPHRSVVIVYDVRGAGQLMGTMELLASAGGYRRENWNVRIDVDPSAESTPSTNVELRTTVIRTPDATWRAREGEPGQVTKNLLGPLAQAYLQLDAPTRRHVARTIHTWQRDLELARSEQPGTTREVVGIRCLDLTVAGRGVCLWEQANIALAHTSEDFEITARSIEIDVELGPHAFDIPDGAEPRAPTDPINVNEELRKLAAGRYASIALAASQLFES